MTRLFVKSGCLSHVPLGLAVLIFGISYSGLAATPCCAITAVDARTATVTAREPATGRTFSFKVTNPNTLNALKVGQGIYANFAAGQVSVDGFNPCCNIVSASANTVAKPFGPIDGATGGKQFGPIDGATSGKPVAPCCSITGINVPAATVSAKETATSKSFSFKVTNPNLLNSMKVGQGIYANFAAGQVSVDGYAPCCNIVTSSGATTANPFGPIDGATGKRFGPIDGVTSTAPAAPCCSITAVDARAGTVTAKDNTTGKSFSFQLSNVNLLNSLKVGQGIYANFGTRQVSVDGLTPCCAITGQPH